jgi:hypothetical protein
MRHPATRRSGRGGLVLAAVLACLGLRSQAPATAAPAVGTWTSVTKGLGVRGVSSLRITNKSPELWFASIYGTKAARHGICVSKDKGATWKPLRQGLEDLVSERDPYQITLDQIIQEVGPEIKRV